MSPRSFAPVARTSTARTRASAALTLALALAAPACTDDPPGDVPAATEPAFAAATASRWPVEPGNVIHYYIDVNGVADALYGDQPGCDQAVAAPFFATSDAQDIKLALGRYEAQTPLRFEELTAPPPSYPGFPVLVFTRGAFDTAHGDNPPDVDLGEWAGCVYLPDGKNLEISTFQHEVGHDLGLIHEQRRSDRDDHVVYDNACVDPADETRYAIIPWSLNLSPYDSTSIMQYQSRLISPCTATYDLLKACEPWVTGCDNDDPDAGCPASEPNCRIIAANTDFSADDRNVLHRMYEPVLGQSEVDDALGEAAVAGDFDGDGYDDLAVGAPGEAPYSDAAGGAVFVYKGTEGGLQAWKVLRASQLVGSAAVHAGDELGAALAARDIDGDGAEELFVGAPGFDDGSASGAGAVFVFRGDAKEGPLPLAVYRQSTLSGVTAGAGDEFGRALAVAKLDGSRWHLVVGIPGETLGGVKAGYVAVLRAASGSTTFAFAQGLQASQASGTTVFAGDRFGSAFATADWNGDGTTDLAIGAPQDSVSGQGGEVFLYKGGTTLASAGRLDDASEDAGGRFGAALAAGNFRNESWPSGKGKKRLVVGAPGKYTSRGKVYVYLATATASGFTMGSRQILDESAANLGMTIGDHDRFGEVLAVADLDADGKDDLAVGVPYEDTSGLTNNGAVAFFRGQAGDLIGWGKRTQHVDLWSSLAYDRYGSAIAAGRFGDAQDDPSDRNDGWVDLAIGAPGRKVGPVPGTAVQDAGSFQALMGDGSIPDYVWTFTQDLATPE